MATGRDKFVKLGQVGWEPAERTHAEGNGGELRWKRTKIRFRKKE